MQLLNIHREPEGERSTISFHLSGKLSVSVLQKEFNVNHTEVYTIYTVLAWNRAVLLSLHDWVPASFLLSKTAVKYIDSYEMRSTIYEKNAAAGQY